MQLLCYFNWYTVTLQRKNYLFTKQQTICKKKILEGIQA